MTEVFMKFMKLEKGEGIPPPLAKVQGGRGGLKYNTGFVLFCLWISPSIHIHIYMYIYICTFFLK